MNKEQELENRQLQNEEIMALEAIYPDDFHKDETSSDAYIFTLNLDQDDDTIRSPRKVILRFFLPPTYPNQDMPIYEIASIYCGTKKLDNDMLEAIDVGFTSLFMPTQVVLFEWISWLRDYLEEHVEKYVIEEETEISNALSQLQVEEGNVDEEEEQEEEEEEIYDFNPEDHYKKETSAQQDDSHDRPTVRSLMGPNSYHTETPPSIFSSEPLVDRKSIFVAHVAQVHTIHQVKVVVAHLLQNKKIAKATHNILAYRITMPDGKVLQDNDDDGESAAGGRLSHLMQILEVENVVVIVTRWFGGIHLGPDRFKDINNIARSALSECGFIKDKHENKHKKKK